MVKKISHQGNQTIMRHISLPVEWLKLKTDRPKHWLGCGATRTFSFAGENVPICMFSQFLPNGKSLSACHQIMATDCNTFIQ